MKKIFTLLSVALLSVSAFAELAYNATLTQNDFNNNKTVIAKIVPDGSEVVWEDGQIRCGGSDKGAFSGPAWNWDDKGVVIALAAGVPNQLSFQYATNNGTSTKGSSNWTAPDWYVDESADGSSWTNAWTTNSNSTSFSSKTVSLKTTTRYIRMYFSGNFAGYFKGIKVTEQILMGTPSPAVLDFGTVKVDDAVEAQTFTINYTGMVPTASSSDTHFTVTPESFGSLYDYKKNQTITVGLKTNEAGEYNGTITVSGRSKSAQVTVSGKVEKYDQSIIWEPAETYNYGEAIPVATATSGLEVIYEISDESVLKFENGAFVTLHGGEVTVTAKQAGNYKYNAAEDVTKTITIVPPTTYGNFEQTTCDEAVTYNYVTYHESFTGDVTVGKNYLGGDSIVHVAITINHATFGTDAMSIVYGDDAEWNGISLKDSTVGVHTVIFVTSNAAGCDSTVTLDLTVNKRAAVEMEYPIEFCAEDQQTYRGVVYTEAGSFPLDLIEGTIRDTMITVVVTVHEKILTTEYKEDSVGHVIELPEGEWYLGEELLEASTYELQLEDTTGLEFIHYDETEFGCDSTVKIVVTVLYEAEPENPGETTAFERVNANSEAVKEFRNGTLYIRRGERLFTAEGREVK